MRVRCREICVRVRCRELHGSMWVIYVGPGNCLGLRGVICRIRGRLYED